MSVNTHYNLRVCPPSPAVNGVGVAVDAANSPADAPSTSAAAADPPVVQSMRKQMKMEMAD